jgi:hypothetical protein
MQVKKCIPIPFFNVFTFRTTFESYEKFGDVSVLYEPYTAFKNLITIDDQVLSKPLALKKLQLYLPKKFNNFAFSFFPSLLAFHYVL